MPRYVRNPYARSLRHPVNRSRSIPAKRHPGPSASEWEDWIPDAYSPESIEVLEENKSPEPTGILDADGTEFFRHPERNPIGFTPK